MDRSETKKENQGTAEITSVKERLKTIGIGKLMLLLFAGVALLVLTFREEQTTPPIYQDSGNTEETYDSENEYYEERLEQLLLETEGIGVSQVMFAPGRDGVVIVTVEGTDAAVAMEVTKVVEVLFGIPAHKVKVLPYNWNETNGQ